VKKILFTLSFNQNFFGALKATSEKRDPTMMTIAGKLTA